MSSVFGKWFKLPSLAERLRSAGVREDVVLAAEATAYGRNTDRALPALAERLSPDELMLKLVEGRHGGPYGLFAVTSARVIFLPAVDGRGLSVDVPLRAVSAVQWRMHRGLGVVEFSSSVDPVSDRGAHPEVVPGQVVVDKILGNQAEAIATRIEQSGAGGGYRSDPAADRDPLEVLAELRGAARRGSDQRRGVSRAQAGAVSRDLIREFERCHLIGEI